MESADGFLFVFPLFAYLIEPGPRPGALRDSRTGTLFVPLWTGRDLFDTFVENFKFGDPISGLRIENRFDLSEFLDRFKNPLITHVAIDPDARPDIPFDLRKIKDIVEQIEKPKPR